VLENRDIEVKGPRRKGGERGTWKVTHIDEEEQM